MSREAIESWAKMSSKVGAVAARSRLAREVGEAYNAAGGDELERLWAEAHRGTVA